MEQEIEKLGYWLEEEAICAGVIEILTDSMHDVVSRLSTAQRSVVLSAIGQVVELLENEAD